MIQILHYDSSYLRRVTEIMEHVSELFLRQLILDKDMVWHQFKTHFSAKRAKHSSDVRLRGNHSGSLTNTPLVNWTMARGTYVRSVNGARVIRTTKDRGQRTGRMSV